MERNRESLILLTDSYKIPQYKMYPDNTTNIYSYFESRNGAEYENTVLFGLQIYLAKYLAGAVITQQDIEDADIFVKEHFMGNGSFNREMWQHIVDVHGGKLPMRIKAVPEGLSVPISNVLMTVEVTDSKCRPLTDLFETILTHIWYGSNVATIGANLKEHITKEFETSVDDDMYWFIDYMLHDFGFRGVSSVESAGIGGAAHLVNFKGTDTLIGITYAQRYYNDNSMLGFSVNATQHSNMTAKGPEGEYEVVKDIMKEFPKGILSMVSDSYSIVNAVNYYVTDLKDDILKRYNEHGGKFVVRPDSPRFPTDKPKNQILWIVETLGEGFGYTLNSKGYKVLHPAVGVIYGDGLSVDEIKQAITHLVDNGWAASNCLYGMGGGLLQKHNRDTQRNAFKCSARETDGNTWHDVIKNPLDKTKKSKAGRLKLIKDAELGYKTVREEEPGDDVLVTVFENGVITKSWTFEEVRNRNNKL